MQSDVLEVTVQGVMPTANGCAVFLGDDDKTFVIYVDHFVGHALQLALDGIKKERPLTHDLFAHFMLGFGITLDRAIINAVDEGTFFARLVLHMSNELGRKIVELDARPSDSLVLAVQQKRPIFAARAVYEQVDDMSEVLQRVLKQQSADAKNAPTDDDDSGAADDDDEEEDDDKA